ncbi:BTAD domain-containing putative transcriptional regulator [Micromonospora sp. NPDC023888]|uniref:AfsR/SARP family transcriptional regulator n=1 Tax=Micromonospora sp. NPDC023888 TaxID=3155607 RepID=UPI00340EDAA0
MGIGKVVVELRVLGPVEVWNRGVPLQFARRQQRVLLGILALEANQLVTGDRLVDLLWGERPPQRARAVLQTRLSEIRAILDLAEDPDPAVLLDTTGGGYRLRVSPEQVDAQLFRNLVSDQRTRGSDDEARSILRAALALWRGPVLGGWLPAEGQADLTQGLEALRLTANEDLFDVELRLGNHRDIVDDVVELAGKHPTRERLAGQMMRALARSGRGPEALTSFDRWRRWLRDELGTDPSAEIQAIHLAVLRGADDQADTDGSRTAVASTQPPRPQDGQRRSSPARFQLSTPRNLPADIADFSGRQAELTRIEKILLRPGAGARIAVVSGPAGVGKTAFSIHVAHRLAGSFPDGQLYVNLRGVDSDRGLAPFEVLGRFLRALGVDGLHLPTTLDERMDLYRDLLADRRLLLLLDNAAADDQLSALIPGGTSCGVLVTSRARLGAILGAQTVALTVMDAADSALLLTRIAGPGRMLDEASATALLSRCAYLPLAIRIVGAKLAAKPHWTVDRLVQMLDDERSRLDRLSHGHLDVRASLALSYQVLSPAARTLLRRLGDIEIAEVSDWLAAALLDTTADRAQELLEQLIDAQLLDFSGHYPSGQPRYRLHDLVRLFGRERALPEAVPGELSAARGRAFGAALSIIEHLVHALWGGLSLTMRGGTPRWEVDELLVGSSATDLLGWFDVERPTIVSIIKRAARDGLGETAWDLACTASPLFPLRRQYDDWQHVLDVAWESALAGNDIRGQAAISYRLGMLSLDRQELDQADEHLKRASRLFDDIGDLHGVAVVDAYLAMVLRFRGQPAAALERYSSALAGLRDTDVGGAAFVLRGMGQAHLGLGDQDGAKAHLDESLALYDTIGSAPMGRGQALFWQGMRLLAVGGHDQAAPLFDHVLRITAVLGDRHGQAQALRGLGICHHRAGRIPQARAALDEALRLVQQPTPSIVESFVQRTIHDLFGDGG